MVAGRFPEGFPLAPPKPGEPTVEVVDRMTTLVYGMDVKFHPITKMPLEDGSGAHEPDRQAFNVHCVQIEQTQGREVADQMRMKLIAAAFGELREKMIASMNARLAIEGKPPLAQKKEKRK